MTAPMQPEPQAAASLIPAVAALAALAAAAALGVLAADGGMAAAWAGVMAAVTGAVGLRLGRARQNRVIRTRLYRVADELVQYRAFTQLLRAQSERIVEMSGEAAMELAAGLREMDERAGRLAGRIAAGDGTPAQWRDEAAAVSAPMVDLLGKLQFQDVTRQQLMFLSRLSLMLDEHMTDLGHMLGDRRALDRTSRFKELFEQAMDETVMTSQRNDHRRAGGIDLFESAGPAVEMFIDEQEAR